MTADPYTSFARWFDALYAAQRTKPDVFQPELVKALLEVISQRGVSSVLDCACGTGDPIIGLAKLGKPAPCVVGTDRNANMLKRCAANAHSEGLCVAPLGQRPTTARRPVVELGLAQWSELPRVFGDRQFDLAMCCGHAIFHQQTRRGIVETLQSMTKVVRPGGYVLADTVLYAPDLHAEVGRKNPDPRGALAANHPLNPLGYAIEFRVTSIYSRDPEAVRGVVQSKRLQILRDSGGAEVEVDSITFEGAPFLMEDLVFMMREAGLCEIQEFCWKPERYRGAIGRHPG